jgi:hypothetical protein
VFISGFPKSVGVLNGGMYILGFPFVLYSSSCIYVYICAAFWTFFFFFFFSFFSLSIFLVDGKSQTQKVTDTLDRVKSSNILLEYSVE